MTSEEQRKIEKLKAEEDVMLSKIRKEEQERLEQLQKEKEEEINRCVAERSRINIFSFNANIFGHTHQVTCGVIDCILSAPLIMITPRLSMEKERLEEEWKAERVLIKEEFESKISSLDKTIDSSEGQIKVCSTVVPPNTADLGTGEKAGINICWQLNISRGWPMVRNLY